MCFVVFPGANVGDNPPTLRVRRLFGDIAATSNSFKPGVALLIRAIESSVVGPSLVFAGGREDNLSDRMEATYTFGAYGLGRKIVQTCLLI